MPSELLYLDDMYLKEFTATVRSVKENKYVVLDRTAFYPKSGGVEHDTGIFIKEEDGTRFKVVYTGKFSGEVSHEIEPFPGVNENLREGDKIRGIIDWDRRYTLMRYHTAAHVLSGVFYATGKIKITGNNLTPKGGRIDFNLPSFDREYFIGLVEEANKVIEKDLPVKVYYINREEAEKDKDLVKLAIGLPPGIEKIRIVEVEGFDRQPDGGCHVASLGEIGKIEIVKIQNKGKNNRRLYFKISKEGT